MSYKKNDPYTMLTNGPLEKHTMLPRIELIRHSPSAWYSAKRLRKITGNRRKKNVAIKVF
jgi:hypothetical protein